MKMTKIPPQVICDFDIQPLGQPSGVIRWLSACMLLRCERDTVSPMIMVIIMDS